MSVRQMSKQKMLALIIISESGLDMAKGEATSDT